MLNWRLNMVGRCEIGTPIAKIDRGFKNLFNAYQTALYDLWVGVQISLLLTVCLV